MKKLLSSEKNFYPMKKNMRNRKGVLYTFLTFAILFGLFMLLMAFFERSSQQREEASIASAADVFAFVEDDIANNIYTQFLGFAVQSITRSGGNVALTLTNITLPSSKNFISGMQNYENYLETTYANNQKLTIALNGFNETFTIQPYGANVQFAPNKFILRSNGTNAVDKLKVKITVNDTANVSSQGQPSDSGDKSVEVEVEIMYPKGSYDKTASLDPTLANSPFFITFESGNMINVSFQGTSGNPGVYTLTAKGLSASVASQEIRFIAQAQNLWLKGGNLSISSLSPNMTKNIHFVLAQE